MKQTAVGILYELWCKYKGGLIPEDFQEAKEMEKQFLKQAFKDSRKANIFEENKPPLYKDFEEWFKQFKNK